MNKRGPKAYREEFRREAIRLTESRPITEVARELGVHPETLRVAPSGASTWRRGGGGGRMAPSVQPLQASSGAIELAPEDPVGTAGCVGAHVAHIRQSLNRAAGRERLD